MVGPAPLFDTSPAEVRPTPAVEPGLLPRLPDRPPATRLRAVLLVALLAVGLADLAVVRQSAPARAVDAPPITPVGTPPPVNLPALVPPATPPTAGPPAAPTASPTAQNAADIAFVRRYYSLLPRDPAAAFLLLGPAARAQSGGPSRYTAFYSGIAAVSIDPTPSVVAPSTVAAVIRFQRRTGVVTHERYELVVGRTADGTPILRSYRRT